MNAMNTINEDARTHQTIQGFVKKNTIVPIVLLFIITFTILVPGFLSGKNLLNIVNQNAPKGVMVIGMTFLIITGYFDLSVGTLMGFCASLAVGLQPWGVPLALLIVVLVGITVGLINGFLVTKVGINAFVVTLASMLGIRGLQYLYTKEQAIVGINSKFGMFGSGAIGPISYMVVIFALLLVLSQYVLKNRRHGRNTYAVGGNTNAAKNAGINVSKTTIINFVICSFSAALAGIMFAARMNAAIPTLGWPDMHMMVIAAVVLGGSKLSGGYGNMYYSLGGLLAIGMIENAMNLLNVQSYFNTLLTGIILIAVLYFDKVLRPSND